MAKDSRFFNASDKALRDAVLSSIEILDYQLEMLLSDSSNKSFTFKVKTGFNSDSADQNLTIKVSDQGWCDIEIGDHDWQEYKRNEGSDILKRFYFTIEEELKNSKRAIGKVEGEAGNGGNSNFPRIAVSATSNLSHIESKLILCSACSNRIAIDAEACPQCGSPNNWIHPEIERFRNSLGEFSHMPQFNVSWHRYVLTGVARIESGNAAVVEKGEEIGMKGFAIGVLILCYAFFASFSNPIAALYIFLAGGAVCVIATVIYLFAFLSEKDDECHSYEFRIDFRESPARWQSNNENFWHDVKKFFLQNSVTD